MVDYIINGETQFKKRKINGRYGHHCLFCDKSFPEVAFNNAPHLLSRMLGSHLYSNFECDSCNAIFSKFETDFSYYLGLGRSIVRLASDRKAPGFTGIDIEVKAFEFKGKKFSVIRKENAERDIDAGTTKLKYGKPTYTPSNVYRLLIKCGLSVLSNNEVKSDYQEALAFLKNDKVLRGSTISIYRYPFTNEGRTQSPSPLSRAGLFICLLL